jgi:hypothetical protein
MRTLFLSVLAAIAFIPGICQAADEPGADPWAARRAKLDERPKKIYAHYMVCFPLGRSGITPSWARGQALKVRHESDNFELAYGGNERGIPLLPDNNVDGLSLEQSADLEIRRAMRAGIDGFAFDVLPASKDQAFEYLDAMFKVCEEKDYPFEITWCLDDQAKNPEVVKYLVEKHGRSPKLARRDGKLLLLGYHSVLSGTTAAARVFAERHPEIKNIDWQSPEMRCSPEGWRLLREGFRDIERQCDTPMYFQFSLGAWGYGVDTAKARLVRGGAEEDMTEVTAVLAEVFDAISGWGSHGGMKLDIAALAHAARAKGAEWGEPMMYQAERLRWSFTGVGPGFEEPREGWRRARDNRATLIQFATWNDYEEASWLAPTTDTRYTLLDLTRYFVDWWKTGEAPKPDHDRVYVSYPPYRHELEVFPFGNRSYFSRKLDPDMDRLNVIEVLTILPAPARVRLPGRGVEWDAPAGLSWKQVPLTPGPVAVELLRGNRTVQRLDCPQPVTDRPFREQHSMICHSTEDMRHWKADFGADTPPTSLMRSDYGDDDKDGLPNWFEMYWFGKGLGDWASATAADPNADPDGDGLTNLQEFLAKTNPRVANAYPNGYVWNLLDQGKKVYKFNPGRDDRDAPVWYYLHKYGPELPIKRDGDYWLCERFVWEPGQDVTHLTFAPWYNRPSPGSATGEISWRWTSAKNGETRQTTPEFVMAAGPQAVQVLAWRSPVTGRVRMDVEARVATNARLFVPRHTAGVLTIERDRPRGELKRVEFSGEKAFAMDASDIDVERGDRLFLVLGVEPSITRHVTPLVFDKLAVTLVQGGAK